MTEASVTRTAFLALVMAAALVPAARAKEELPLEKLVFTDALSEKLPYRLLKPEKIDPAKKYPLVVFLHGAGERGNDNEKQLVHGVTEFASKENRAKHPCFLIAPQCPDGAKWADVDWGADRHTLPKEMSTPARLTVELVETMLKTEPIDSKRIYLTGLSMGGFGTWDLIARRPDLFAAAAPVCGGGDEATAEKIKNIPVWAFHGAKDGAVKVARSRNMITALEKVGGKPKYTEYLDVGHNSWDRAYKDPEFFRWLFAQKQD
jgi:predicted peptidase